MASKNLPPFDKYKLYTASVQSTEADVEFLEKAYMECFGKSAEGATLREDFCGTFALCCEWVKRDPANKAIGVDLDSEPIGYGMNKYYPKLVEDQKNRLRICEQDVLAGPLPETDICCALNFSYFIFKERETLKKYFQGVYDSLGRDGIFLIDVFGGPKCCEANEEETEYTDEKFSYFWDQDSYDPLSNHAQFYIHFQRKGEAKAEKAFSYDWRMWSLPELKDILKEVGFSQIDTYWEESDEEGDGNGIFSKVEVGEECESWVAYLMSKKTV